MAIEISEKAQRMARRIIDGHLVKYDQDVHIPMLIALFENGDDVASFCSEAEISEQAFYDWVKKYPEFSKSYDHAKQLAKLHHQKVGEVGLRTEGFNVKLWSIIGRNRFGQTEHRKLHIPLLKKAKSFIDQYDVIKNEIAQGNLTGNEANQIVGMIATGANISQSTRVAEEVDRLKQLVEAQYGT